MKQHITPEDLNQLTQKGRVRLREWWKPNPSDESVIIYPDEDDYLVGKDDYLVRGVRAHDEYGDFDRENKIYDDEFLVYPLLSIGQCIQFLYDHDTRYRIEAFDTKQVQVSQLGHYGLSWYSRGDKGVSTGNLIKNELIDSLWEVVKQVLEQECKHI